MPKLSLHLCRFSVSSLLIALLLLLGCSENSKKPVPVAQNGVLDLSQWDFANDGSIELKGDWLFWWGTFIDPANPTLQPPADGTMPVPKTWGGRQRPGHPGQTLTMQGFASYALDIILPKNSAAPLAIWQLDTYSAQTLEVVEDSKTRAYLSQGVPGQDASSETPHYTSLVKSFEPSTARLRVIWKISNFHHARGGARKTPILGYESILRKNLLLEQVKATALVVLLLTMSLYLFGLVTQRPDDHATLWFGLTLFITSIWYFLNSRMLQVWYSNPTKEFHEWTNTVEYIAVYLILSCQTTFIYHIAPRPWFRRCARIIQVFILLKCIVPLTNPLLVYSNVHVFYSWADLLIGCIVWGHLFIETLRGSKLARLTLIGFSPFAASRIHDILKVIGLPLETPFLTPYGLVLLVLVQSHIMARFFAETFKSNEKLGRDLQKEVDRQTEELRLQKGQLELQQNELMRAHECLKDADEQKTRFFRSISHELRTPLTLILGTLSDSDDVSRLRRSMEIASYNARRLYRLVNQLLDFQKIALSKVHLRMEAVDLESFLRGLEKYVSESCRNMGLNCRLVIHPATQNGYFVRAQLDALEKVLFNYLGNALKFTPKGGEISVEMSARGSFIRIEVKDTGCGIPKNQQDKLFRLFLQIEGPHQKNKQGTGLGLALVKELAGLMQGTVGVSSDEGQGSTFWLELPSIPRPTLTSNLMSADSDPERLRAAETMASVESVLPGRDWQLADVTAIHQHVQTQDSPDNPTVPYKARLLVVDDVTDIRCILHDMLASEGYQILHAENGRHALERIQALEGKIDIIITDWMMPEMNGVELIEALHRDPGLATIPTILLTAKSDESSRSQGLRVGASAYLGKPFDQRELVSVVENLLDLKRREREVVELNRFINEHVLQRFLPPELVKELLEGKAIFDDAAKLQTITVMFADLCGFTRSTERLGPNRISRILNSFLVRMTDIIFEEGGTIDKFIGDGLLVFFGAPTVMDSRTQVAKASRCALRMQEALVDLNKEWLKAEKHSFQMRIGIHHGAAVVGSFGGKRRSDYTAIGHTVNLASRIESKAEPGEIFISAEVRDYLDDEQWEVVGEFELKGVKSELTLYRLLQPRLESAA